MKSCIIERSADTRLDLQCLPSHILLEDNYFATVPLIAVRPVSAPNRKNEEELLTSFEDAISDRVQRVSLQLKHSSSCGSLPATAGTGRARQLRARSQTRLAGLVRFWQTQRQTIQLLCLGLCLLSLGFDLMGILVLAH